MFAPTFFFIFSILAALSLNCPLPMPSPPIAVSPDISFHVEPSFQVVSTWIPAITAEVSFIDVPSQEPVPEISIAPNLVPSPAFTSEVSYIIVPSEEPVLESIVPCPPIPSSDPVPSATPLPIMTTTETVNDISVVKRSPTPIPSPTKTRSPHLTTTPTPTSTPTSSSTATPTESATLTTTTTPTSTSTSTATPTQTMTPTPTESPSPTPTTTLKVSGSSTATPTWTKTTTPTTSSTTTTTASPTSSISPTMVPSQTVTPFPTVTGTPSPSESQFPKVSSTPTPSLSKVASPSMSPTPTPSISPRASKSGRCSFHARNGVLNIAADAFNVRGDWSRTPEGGVTYKKHGGSRIEAKGTADPFCVRFTPDQDGSYYFTVKSSAPHPTDHNDAWFRFSANVVGFRPISGSVINFGRSSWLKGFQNLGGNKIADYVLTVDHNGHQLFLDDLKKGVEYRACASGRSSRFTLYNFVFIACNSMADCSRASPAVSQIVAHLPHPAECT